jgi:hypothetical protein
MAPPRRLRWPSFGDPLYGSLAAVTDNYQGLPQGNYRMPFTMTIECTVKTADNQNCPKYQ